MNNHHLIADSHTLAYQQLERLRILLLSLMDGEVRSLLPDCQGKELDAWMFDLVCQAQDHLDVAKAHLAQMDKAAA